jgi:Lysyl oxidase
MAAGIAAAIGACGAALVFAADSARSRAEGEQLLPDLVVRWPHELYVERRGDRIRLRVSNTVANKGKGPLELTGGEDNPECDNGTNPGRTTVQTIFRDSADTDSLGYFERDEDTLSDPSPAGCSRFHATHNHWHFDNFARYTLYREKTGKAVAGSRKVSFCVIDTGQPFGELDGSPLDRYYPQDPTGQDPEFPTCSETSVDGLSIGWEDTYSASLPGQGILVDGLPRGRYCLTMEADPPVDELDTDGVLEEVHEDNNLRELRIRMRPHRLVVKHLGNDCPSFPA